MAGGVAPDSGAEAFGRLVLELASYTEDVVFVGGWVHALYVAEIGSGARPVRTEDIDLNLPRHLERSGRPPLLDLVRRAGFDIESLDSASGLVEIYRGDVRLDLLTEAADPRQPIRIEGQEALVVQGYPYQDFLRANARRMRVGPEVHPDLAPFREIRVPSLGAYLIGKVLSCASRTVRFKQVNDLVYVLELIRDEDVRRGLESELPHLMRRYPREAAIAAAQVRRFASDRKLLHQAATQLLESFRLLGSEDEAVPWVTAQLRRLQQMLDVAGCE